MEYKWKRKRINISGKEDSTDSETSKKVKTEDKKTDPWNGGSESPDITVIKNHIYFYCGVTKKSSLKLNTELRKINNTILGNGRNILKEDRYIYLHINSYGGSVFAAFSVIDTIKNLSIPVISIIEGAAASAATLISCICDYRIIRPTAFMLIHELSSSTWGKMSDIEDEVENLRKLMDVIKKVYRDHTEIPVNELDDILKHDIWWDAKKCLAVSLVDEIYKTKKIYRFDRQHLDI